MTVRILFDLKSGWGLGDAVQSSILWKHLKRYRPHWRIDVRCPRGVHAAIAPFVHRVWDVDDTVDGEYDAVQSLGWTDCFETFADRPSTKVAFALKNVFGIEEYDPALGRYEVVPTPEDWQLARRIANKCGLPMVVIHNEGNSHPEKKNVPELYGEISYDCSRIGSGIASIPNGSTLGAGRLAAEISLSSAFIGIDSGPGKVASATDTPTLICWTGHHPLRYHDPAPNTTHLMPATWAFLPPFDELENETAKDVSSYFHNNYQFRTYRPGELAHEACRWLRETLK